MSTPRPLVRACATALALVAFARLPEASAQGMDPSMPMSTPMPDHSPAKAARPAHKPRKKSRAKSANPSGGTAPRGMVKPMASPDEAPATMDHAMSEMADDAMPGMDMPTPRHPAAAPITPVPAPTDADRVTAFPAVMPHPMHDNDAHGQLLFDRFEAWNARGGASLRWDGAGWFGTDLDRLWIRSEGERTNGRVDEADVEALYGHSVATWWDLVGGVRHDMRPGAGQDWLAVGVMGLAPGKFELKATGYLGSSGRTSLRLEVQRELLLTNRLILQPLVEVNLFGRDDPRRGVGSGLSTVEAGLRLRYEITRRLAPYLGVVRERAFGGTADARRSGGEDVDTTRVVAGIRFWF